MRAEISTLGKEEVEKLKNGEILTEAMLIQGGWTAELIKNYLPEGKCYEVPLFDKVIHTWTREEVETGAKAYCDEINIFITDGRF